jgi:thiol-disulfide isomerase/thioredoxin
MSKTRRSLAALLAVSLLAACGGGGDGTGEEVDLDDPYQLPSGDMETFEAVLADLRGTPVVVNVWASWCGPCRDEAGHLSDAAKDHDGEVQFLGVDVLDNREPARDFIREFDWTYPSLFDADADIRDGLGFVGQPETVFFDADGNLVFQVIGPVSPEDLEHGIALASGEE